MIRKSEYSNLSTLAVMFLILAMLLGACASPATPEQSAAVDQPAKTEQPAVQETEEAAKPAETEETAEDKPLIVATFRNLVNQYWIDWNQGGKEAADALGAEYLALSADDSEQKQLAAVEDAIAQGADALVIQPVSDAALVALVELAEESKVPFVVMWDRPQDLLPDDYEYWVAHVTQDAEWQGYTIAKTMFDGMGGSGKIVAIDGIPGTYCNDQRVAGLNRALEEYPDIELLGSIQPGGYNRFDATPVMEDFIAAYGEEIQGVWTANDDMAIGVIETLKAANMEGVFVAGVDTIGEAVDAIIAGDMYVTLGGDAQGMHGTGVMYAYDAIMGFRPAVGEKEIFWSPPVVTIENAEQIKEDWFTNYTGHDWKAMSMYYSQ